VTDKRLTNVIENLEYERINLNFRQKDPATPQANVMHPRGADRFFVAV